MNYYADPNDWEREYPVDPGARDYADLYHRAQRVARTGSSFSPPATAAPIHEFVRQQSAPSGSAWPRRSSRGSYDEPARPTPSLRRHERERSDPSTLPTVSSSPRTPRNIGGDRGSGGSNGGGSVVNGGSGAHRRVPSSPSYVTSGSPDHGVGGGRKRANTGDRVHRDSVSQEPQQRARDQASQRVRYAVQSYPTRLASYLQPLLGSGPAMEQVVDVFLKLDDDARYLTRSATSFLQGLADVADARIAAAAAAAAGGGSGGANGSNGGKHRHNGSRHNYGTGLDDDIASDSEDSDESILDNMEIAATDSAEDEELSDEDVEVKRPVANHGRRRSSNVNGTGKKGSFSSTRKTKNGKSGAGLSGRGPFLAVTRFFPQALSKSADSLNDREKSFLAVAKVADDIDFEDDEVTRRGFLAHLLRILAPRHYRSYFRTTARILLVPESPHLLRHEDELTIERLERQLLHVDQSGRNTGGDGPTIVCITYSSAAYGAVALYRLAMGPASRDSGEWPKRLEVVAAMEGVPKELLRQTAKAVVPARRTVLKVCQTDEDEEDDEDDDDDDDDDDDEHDDDDDQDDEDSISEEDEDSDAEIDRRRRKHNTKSKRKPPPPPPQQQHSKKSKAKSKDDASEAPSSASGSSSADPNASSSSSSRIKSSLRWTMPADAPTPGLGYSPNVGRSSLSSALYRQLALDPSGRQLTPAAEANLVHATVPAMIAWLHVDAAYLQGVVVDGPELQRGSSGSKSTRSKDKDDRDKDRRVRRVLRWKGGPTSTPHEGSDPCIVVVHPRGEWTTTPVYWTEEKDV